MTASKTVAAMLCVSMVSSLFLTQDVAAARATGGVQVPATIQYSGNSPPPRCCTPEASKASAKDDIGISIGGGGGGHVSITGSIHVGGKGKPKHGSNKGTPSYGQP